MTPRDSSHCLIEAEILSALGTLGFFPDELVLNGEIQRHNRHGRKNMWLVGHKVILRTGRAFASATVGDWKTGEKYTVKTNGSFSKIERGEIAKIKIRHDAEIKAKTHEAQKLAAESAVAELNRSTPLGSHKYLNAKGLKTFAGGLEITEGSEKAIFFLVRDVEGKIWGSQKIFEDGSKSFGKGQKNKSNFILLPSNENLALIKKVYACEGIGTAQTILNADGVPVVCALNAHNLQSVCEALKNTYPHLEIIVVGDDDRHLSPNIGREKATSAARAINAPLVFPKFQDDDHKSTDFNDLFCREGIGAVREQLRAVEPAPSYSPNSVMLAEQFLAKQERRLVSIAGQAYRFNGQCYELFDKDDFKNSIVRFVQADPIAWHKSRGNFIRDIQLNIKPSIAIEDAKRGSVFFISDKDASVGDLINVQNGLLDIEAAGSISELRLLPHSDDLFTTSCLPFKFDPKARCDRWLKFLDEMIPDAVTRSSLQEWIGLNTLFDTSFQIFAIYIGNGANGKSVVCCVQRTLLGEKSVSSVNLEGFQPGRTFPLCATVGKLANIVQELNVDSKVAEGEIKKFTSGEPMTIEEKFRKPFQTIPTARLTFATNTFPRFTDSTTATWRRAHVYPFTVKIDEPAKQDRRLTDSKFWIESGEMPGILNWALEGLFRLRRNKAITVSEEMRVAMFDHQSDSNPTRQFLLETFQEVAGEIQEASVAYQAYVAHMKSHGYAAKPYNDFAREVLLAFPGVTRPKPSRKHKRRRIFLNLGCIGPDTPDTPQFNSKETFRS